jgi:hypothetical protein
LTFCIVNTFCQIKAYFVEMIHFIQNQLLPLLPSLVSRHYTVYKVVWRTYTYKEVELSFVYKYLMVELFVVCSRVYVVYSIGFRVCHPHTRTFCPTSHILRNPAYYNCSIYYNKCSINNKYIYVWKLNQTVLELDFRAVKFFCSSLDGIWTHTIDTLQHHSLSQRPRPLDHIHSLKKELQ